MASRATRRTEQAWIEAIDPAALPRHIAIIMDGNGRWARRRHMPRHLGHARGAEATEDVIDAVRTLPERLAALRGIDRSGIRGVEYLTLYTFSAENWRRPADEVSLLMNLIERMLREKLDRMHQDGIRVRLLGQAAQLPDSLRQAIDDSIEQTAENTALTLFLALNYGGRREIVDAARRLAEQVGAGALRPEEIDESRFAGCLYAPDVPDPDLMIRTGGDMRVSNFLLWQIAYAELWITGTLWPSFRPAEIYQAIAEYQTRPRRFGGLNGHSAS